MTEDQLVRQAQMGDREAFAALVGLHERFVYNLALRSLGDAQDAADAAQDAFVRAWLGLPQFGGRAQFRTWLYRIVINQCINRSPRLRRYLDALTEEQFSELPAEEDVAAQVEERQLYAHVHREVERLPEQYRLLVSLRYQHGLSYEEIASLLNLPLGTVKTGLFRAKSRLRESLAACWETTL
ncbi:MAG: sigma-70 family RNA polymerase sigma factor [Chloroflexi bacterium]|nr:sigma-70 family RNA polymerase sigma factor [Chloroflexota bacterium]